jgi:hypothetical protein
MDREKAAQDLPGVVLGSSLVENTEARERIARTTGPA